MICRAPRRLRVAQRMAIKLAATVSCCALSGPLCCCPLVHVHVERYPSLTGPLPQYINVTCTLVTNIYVLSGRCRWFSPFVTAMG